MNHSLAAGNHAIDVPIGRRQAIARSSWTIETFEGRTRHARRRPAGTDILPEVTVEAVCRPSRSLGVLTGESLSTPMPIVASYPQHAKGGHARRVIAPPTAVSTA